jgi:hypothetical protein
VGVEKLAFRLKWQNLGDRKCLAIGEDRLDFCGNEFFNTTPGFNN